MKDLKINELEKDIDLNITLYCGLIQVADLTIG